MRYDGQVLLTCIFWTYITLNTCQQDFIEVYCTKKVSLLFHLARKSNLHLKYNKNEIKILDNSS